MVSTSFVKQFKICISIQVFFRNLYLNVNVQTRLFDYFYCFESFAKHFPKLRSIWINFPFFFILLQNFIFFSSGLTKYLSWTSLTLMLHKNKSELDDAQTHDFNSNRFLRDKERFNKGTLSFTTPTKTENNSDIDCRCQIS